MPDHVHLFVDCPPTLAPQQLANQFKGYTSRVLRDECGFAGPADVIAAGNIARRAAVNRRVPACG
jgi:REP element-mobilizing transposase RayT